ncbi:hypothetical protein [Silvanigrella aquatica]|uniref:hypothetical protein n=1 Tax=Silvanigrella aquatica TaxID=1915309 RepID=UPI0011E58D45|nr:hypothetical protein [Silvanigrella aquatica]
MGTPFASLTPPSLRDVGTQTQTVWAQKWLWLCHAFFGSPPVCFSSHTTPCRRQSYVIKIKICFK